MRTRRSDIPAEASGSISILFCCFGFLLFFLAKCRRDEMQCNDAMLIPVVVVVVAIFWMVGTPSQHPLAVRIADGHAPACGEGEAGGARAI